MSSFSRFVEQGLKKHPMIFSSLEEFERTKRIPKFSYRKRLDVTIDEHVLKKFKKYCMERGLNMSRVIEHYLRKELEKVRPADGER